MNQFVPASSAAGLRPWLTRTCERLLQRLPWPRNGLAGQPLSPSPSRLLVVKVHGMGDAVLVRSAIEHLRSRNPSLAIGVLAGEATQEVLTVGANFKLHRYSQKSLTLRSALQTLREIKACSYDAVLNFEQGSLAGSGFLHATRIPSRIGFVTNGSSAKIPFLTHAIGFHAEASMWQSFLEIARLVDSRMPESLSPMPLPLSDEELNAGRSWLQRRVTNPLARKIAFHLGCGIGQPFKRWPLRNFAVLGDSLARYDPDLAIILTGQSHERGLVAEFGSIYKGSALDATATEFNQYDGQRSKGVRFASE